MAKISLNIDNPKKIFPKILLHPNIPKPLHGIAPRTISGQGWWNKIRLQSYQKNNYCWACGIHKLRADFFQRLEAHEYYKINYDIGQVKYIQTVALCYMCHNFIHSGRLEILKDTGKISNTDYHKILDHGLEVLKKADLLYEYEIIQNEMNSPSKVEWQNWYMLFEG